MQYTKTKIQNQNMCWIDRHESVDKKFALLSILHHLNKSSSAKHQQKKNNNNDDNNDNNTTALNNLFVKWLEFGVCFCF